MSILDTLERLSELLEVYGLQVVFVFAVAFVIWYFVGSWINLKIARRYARAIEGSMETRSLPVKYRRISGGRGFRALCLMRDKEIFERIEIAINLADRDNVMHYVLSPITRDEDRFLCWAFMNIKPPSNIEIIPKKRTEAFYKSMRKYPEKYGEFKLCKVDETFDDEFSMFADDDKIISKIFPKKICDHILGMKKLIRNISVIKGEDFIRVVGVASEKNIPLLLDLAWKIGECLAYRYRD